MATPSTATASPTPVAAEEETVIAPAAEVATETAPPEAAEETTITAAVPTEAAAEAAKPTEPAPAPAAERGANLRNPATGEIAVIPTNYRFAKKWIKEALVAEGLLDRIYKPNELDEATSQRVKDALEQLRSLDKYQA